MQDRYFLEFYALIPTAIESTVGGQKRRYPYQLPTDVLREVLQVGNRFCGLFDCITRKAIRVGSDEPSSFV
ncbi:hypothetical protein HWV23_10785 [Natronomonas halophila]|uniref:hypothetical protein n=1 Tax=Natronomonas halophila TaxID=2747817 RepID=UPI0015B431F2|nr:hypothetical protein [Natronomonas halophila]QLD86186.1 hypothetical protein HWV23_10785 [Natronomonas halophila]